MIKVKRYLYLAFALLLFCGPVAIFGQQEESAIISGQVIDASSHQPLPNAKIIILGPGWWDLKFAVTDSQGLFYTEVGEEGWYSIYAFQDNETTSGIDYIPAQWDTYLQLGSQTSFVFTLVPGASLLFRGEIRFVESPLPASVEGFAVLNPSGYALRGRYSATQFLPELSYRLKRIVGRYDLQEMVGKLGVEELVYAQDRNIVVVPAETEVIVEVSGTVYSGYTPIVQHDFMVDGKTGFFKLRQGEALAVDFEEYCLRFNIDSVKEMIDSTFTLLYDVRDAGFLVTAERRDLLESLNFVQSSLLTKKKKSYDESFSNIRRAYILTSETKNKLRDLAAISSSSALTLTVFFVFIALVTTYLFRERRDKAEIRAGERRILAFSLNYLIATAIYILLLTVFYLMFPGCRLVPPKILLITALLALIVGLAMVKTLPSRFEEKRTERRSIAFRSAIVTSFSMACRNLRRRKRSTTIGIVNIMILMFGFIALTSVSPGYGLVLRTMRSPAIPVEALLVRKGAGFLRDPLGPLIPLPSSFLTWLENQPNVTSIAPKAENYPSMTPLGELTTVTGAKLYIYGILGVVPSAEYRITRLNETLIEGRFLSDGDHDGIVISASAQFVTASGERVGVKVGDTLYGFQQKFTVVGLFDADKMKNTRDLEDSYIVPYRVYPLSGPAPCSGDRIFVTTLNRSLTLPNVVISRVNVQLKAGEGLIGLARTITVTREFETWVSMENKLYQLKVGAYMEEKGIGIIPFLVLLVLINIGVAMVGSVERRRSEIAILSSVGLNPAHITALFMAEAVILGFIGGGLGYLLGISSYRIASETFLGVLQVREKVSAQWAIVALLLSVTTSVLATVIPAMKASTIVTPSLLRTWKLETKTRPEESAQPWKIDLPVKIKPKEVGPLIGFILNRLRDYSVGSTRIDALKFEEEVAPVGGIRRLHFRYVDIESNFEAINELVISPSIARDSFEAVLFCSPSSQAREELVHKTASLVRKFIFEWNTLIFQVATLFDPSLSRLYTLINVYNPTALYLVTTKNGKVYLPHLTYLKERLKMEGSRIPNIFVSKIDPNNIQDCMRKAEEVVSKVNMVCVTGEPSSLSTALTLTALKQNKMMCHVVDPRSPEHRRADPFHVAKVVPFGQD